MNDEPTPDLPAAAPLDERTGSEKGVLTFEHLHQVPPLIERAAPRTQQDLIGRALVMNAMIYLGFEAPVDLVRDWIVSLGAFDFLSPHERSLLDKADDEITVQERKNLTWYMEGLWALMWAGSMIEELPFDQEIPDGITQSLPLLDGFDSGDKITEHMVLRSYEQIYLMTDLYYKVHSRAVSGRRKGYSTGDVNVENVMERRKALEWLNDAEEEWDDIRQDT